MPRIFISYRRDDSADVTGRIYEHLTRHFGPASVFKDVENIPLGVDFREHLTRAVSGCDAVLVIIGRCWLDARDDGGQRRLDDARDYVRIEVEVALKRGVPVIPVLVQGVSMPKETTLPPSIKPLTLRNGTPVRPDPDFHHDMDRLAEGLDKHFRAGAPGPEPKGILAKPGEPARERIRQPTPLGTSKPAAGSVPAGVRPVLASAARKPWISRTLMIAIGVGAGAIMGAGILAFFPWQEVSRQEKQAAVGATSPYQRQASRPSVNEPKTREQPQVKRPSESKPNAPGPAQANHPSQPKPGDSIINGLGMKFAWIPPGKFLMGSPADEKGRSPEEVQHEVTLTSGFWLATTLVTQASWEHLMGNNPSHFKGKNLPVENVSWDDCQEFLRKLSALDGHSYRLPTEAEWEYAARAGTTTAYSFGDDPVKLGDYAWFLQNSGGHTHEVATKKPNPWGLYDMHGNVWEWCADWKGPHPAGRDDDPKGPKSGNIRVLRGGSFDNRPASVRSALRFGVVPASRSSNGGFRPSRTFTP